MISAACARSANSDGEKSANARENVAVDGSLRFIGNPQMRRSARSSVSRLISATVVPSSSPSTALATNALASHARSCGGRPTSAPTKRVNASIRTHSSVWITRSWRDVSPSSSTRNYGSSSF